jgi:integrase
MAKVAKVGALHLLSAREVMAAGDGYHSDGGGLLLAVRGQSRNWVYRFTSPSGRRREMGLGPAPCATLKMAGENLTLTRDAAHEAREMVRRGRDPIDERERAREAARAEEAARKAEKARQALTLARAARNYHERVIEPTRTTKHAAQWIASLENHIPLALWHAPVDAIEAPALLSALSKTTPHERARNVKGPTVPETLRRIRQRLDAVFEDAIFHGHATRNPAAAIKRKLAEALPAKAGGQLAALPYGEAPALMQRLRSWPGTAARCLEFAVLTAARTSEAIGATWAEIDLQAGTWVLPAERMKADEPHLVPLSPRVVEILRVQLGQDTRLVFPSPMALSRADGDRKPLSNMALLTLLGRMKYRDRTTVHGLCRATFSTWANETGAARPDVIEACLAHEESNRVRAAYNRAKFNEERRQLLEAWAGYLKGADVIALKTA